MSVVGMRRGRRPAGISGYVSSVVPNEESHHGVVSFPSNTDGRYGQTIRSSSFRVGCMANFSEGDLDHLYILPSVLPCRFCGAKKFHLEPPSFCCDRGQIRLVSPVIPTNLMSLFMDGRSTAAIAFRRKIRLYNSIFSFTSFGVRVDKDLASSTRGVYTFRVAGQIFHGLPPLIPSEERPTHFQLYFWDNENELRNRMNVINGGDVDEQTMLLLMDIMTRNPYAEILRKINQYPSIKDLCLQICKNAAVDQRCYNSPSADQVAAIWVEGNNPNIPYDRDILVRGTDGRVHQIKHYFGCYDPLQYPLFFPLGDNGWHQHIPKFRPGFNGDFCDGDILVPTDFSSFDAVVAGETEGVRASSTKMVSCREYYCYRLQIRESHTSMLLYGARLLQQFVVDMYIKLETTRLDYFRRNQVEMRSELYQGIVDSVFTGEARGSQIGHRVVLPASFIGGPRDMRRRYLDAIALVRTFGKPDLFITMTCNPDWKEIKDNLFDGQVAQDRPDLVSRVFRAKLLDLKDQITKKFIFGRVSAYVYVIEFQKRGLPHAHMLVILDNDYKINSADMFDNFVSAELPSKDLFPRLFGLVIRHMIHGPCGSLNRKNSCMVGGRCKSHYPRSFSENSTQGPDGYPIYRRRNDGQNVDVRNAKMNSQWVVPYNPYLLYRYDCHINVEICLGLTAVKYLYKYIYKGHDKIGVYVGQRDPDSFVDEIREFQDARWVSAQEAMWRIYEFDLNEISPAVINLPLHLPNKQSVTFWNNQNLRSVLNLDYVSKTMLTEFFYCCSIDLEARLYLYSEFPEHYVWDKKAKMWLPRKQRRVIGRINAVNPVEGERYYLRLLLLHVRGPTSYNDLLTVDRRSSFSFKEAAQRRGLLECDHSNFECLNEVVSFHMPYALRRLFATILVYCAPADVKNLWDSFYHHLSEDFKGQGVLNDVEILYETLQSLNCFLESMGKKTSLYDLPAIPDQLKNSGVNICREIMDEKSIPISSDDLAAHSHLNAGQQSAYDVILDCVNSGGGGLFFVNGPGGTGKTFLYRALLADVRSKNMIALATATSGVAASILPGGRTAHSRFKIPIELHDNSFCSISKQSGLAQLLRQTRLIVWDEAPMCRRFAIEAVDRTLQDLVGIREPFGGKVVVLGGDFMQVLPVIPKATIQETINGSLAKSPLYGCMRQFVLSENMRARSYPSFCDFLLRIGQGLEPVDKNGNIKIPAEMIIRFCDDDMESSEQKLIEHVYRKLEDNYHSAEYMTKRAILATKNCYVDKLNEKIITLFPGEVKTFLSFDEAIDDTQNFYPEEFLNSLAPNVLPPHRLILKKNCPIMLLRNLDPSDGMCNGTRMVCRDFKDNVIHAEIAVGHHYGKKVMIPRNPLSSADNEGYPFQFRRKQFPIRLCFAMMINKAQGQTLPIVGVYLPEPVFSHGQLYVALSRGTSMKDTKILIRPNLTKNIDDSRTKNIVYMEIFDHSN